MAKKIYVKLQTPVLEMAVTARDGGGNAATIYVGYRRYDSEKVQQKLNAFRTLTSKFTAESSSAALDSMNDEVCAFLEDEISYIRNAELFLEDEEGKLTSFSVSDSRNCSDNEALWGPANAAVPFLLRLYFASAPWRASLISAWFKASLNVSEETELKN